MIEPSPMTITRTLPSGAVACVQSHADGSDDLSISITSEHNESAPVMTLRADDAEVMVDNLKHVIQYMKES